MAISQDGLTPWREVSISFDVAEAGHSEPFFARQRDRFAIQPEEISGCEQLASGVWQLKPNETDLSMLHETTAGQASIIRLPDVVTIPNMIEVPMQRQYPELSGLSPGASVSPSGDHHMLRRNPISVPYSQSIISSTPSPTLSPTPRYPMDRIVESKSGPGSAGIDPEDQGYVIRWYHPGGGHAFTDYLWSFIWGGPITPQGYGMFCLTVGGAGKAQLHEWIEEAWVVVEEWVWAPAELIPGRWHTMRIIPHCGRWIEFKSSVTDRGTLAGRQTAHRPTGLHGQEVRPHAQLYEAKNRRGLPTAPSGTAWPMSGPGRFRFDARRDARFPFQVTRLTYPETGYIVEPSFRIPNTPGTLHVLEVLPRGVVRKDYLTGHLQGEIVPEPIDVALDTSLAPQSETFSEGGVSKTIDGYECPPAPHAVKVKLFLNNLEGITHVSPWLLGYECRRRGDFATPSVTPLTITDSHRVQSPCTRLEIDSGDEDPTHARASLRIADLTNRLSRVRNRGEINIRVETTYDRSDQTKKSVIFEGYAVKPVATLRGNLSGVVYPSPDWHELRVECVGKHHRIAKRDFPKQVLSFVADPNAPPDKENLGSHAPWKVTDAVRLLLQTAGVPDAQLLIPDLSMRLWSNGDPDQEHLQISVGTPILEFVQTLLHDYLNYFLVYDPNALTAGAWRALPAPRVTDPVLWNYQADGPGAGKLAHHPGSYAAKTTFMDSWESWPVAPLGNWLQVTAGAGDASAKHYTVQVRNPLSYDRPGDSLADPDDPDYLGYLSPLYRRIDGRITTKAAAYFTARVTFERVCRSQRYGRLISPAVLVTPNEPTVYTTNLVRPHFYGDHITIDSGDGAEDWFVTSCHWEVPKKHLMTQVLEVQRFNEPLSYEA